MGGKVANKHVDKIDIMIDEHLQYEVQNFIFCTNYLYQSIESEIFAYKFKFDYPEGASFKIMLNHLILENWVMGLRKLSDFLYKSLENKKIDNDWFIADKCFSESRFWLEFIKSKNLKTDVLEKYIVRTHKMSAHISFDRVTDKLKYDYGWEIKIAEPVFNGLNLFYTEINNNPNSYYTKGINYQINKLKDGILTLNAN